MFPLYATLYVWNIILKLLHVPGSCSCKMTPSVGAPSNKVPWREQEGRCGACKDKLTVPYYKLTLQTFGTFPFCAAALFND